MNTLLYFFLVLGYLCLLVWGSNLTKGSGLLHLSNVLLLVIVGLIYDNLMLAIGKFIGEGNLLESLSYNRYFFHALFTPTLILFAWSICNGTGLPWAQKAISKILAVLLTFGLILYELLTSVKGLKLEPKWQNGVLTYEKVGQSSSPVMVIIVTLVLAVVGFIFLKKFRFPWLFLGTMAMMFGSLFMIWEKNFPIMNVLEWLLMVTLLMTKQFQLRYQRNSRLP